MLSRFLLLLVVVGSAFGAATFTNPIKKTDGSDPYLVYINGYYYLTTTTWSNIQIARATMISGLKSASPKVVWSEWHGVPLLQPLGTRNPLVVQQMAHVRPRTYYSAGTSGTFDNQRLHVLEGSSTDIWNSTWSYKSRVTIPNCDVWSIDGTLAFLGSNTYLVYSSWDGDNQCVYIAQMTSATTVGNATKISTPAYSWEQIGANVNEGPAMLYYGDRTFLVYSASNCAGTGHELGRLELTGSNPLSASSWTKYPQPIFTSGNGNYEPEHNGIFNGPSGNIYMVYHASSTSPGTCDGKRYTMVQPVYWHSDNSPNLGSPRALSDAIPEPS